MGSYKQRNQCLLVPGLAVYGHMAFFIRNDAIKPESDDVADVHNQYPLDVAVATLSQSLLIYTCSGT